MQLSIPVHYNPSIFSSRPFTPANKKREMVKKVFDKSEIIWNYLGKVPLLTRHVLNISIKVCRHFDLACRKSEDKILRVITELKLFSIVGIPFSVRSIKSVSDKIFKSYALGDKEGVALASFSFTIMLMELFDSVTTLINTISTLATHTSIEAISAMGSPLSIGIIGASSISRFIQLIKTHLVFKKFQQQNVFSKALSADTRSLHFFLREKLELSSEDIKASKVFSRAISSLAQEKEIERLKTRKLAILNRSTSPEIMTELTKIYNVVKQEEPLTTEQAHELAVRTQRLQFLFRKKMILDKGHLAANALSVIGVSLFYAPLPPILPFIFLALSTILRLALIIYQKRAQAPALSLC